MVGLYNIDRIDSLTWQWQEDTGSEVLERVKKLLSKNHLKLSEVEAIAVNQGPGSYTGVRVGITIANALGWSLEIPVIGYSSEDTRKVAQKITENIKKKNFSTHFPTPIYKN